MKFSYPPQFLHDASPAMWQNPFEFRATVNFLASINAKSMLEIGTGYGEMARFLRVIKGMFIVSIDKAPLKEGLSNVFIGDSTSPEALGWASGLAKATCIGEKYDVVYIDGGHDYKTCLHDFKTYSELAKKAVIIHDIDGNQAGKYPVELGPNKVWETHKGIYRTLEIHAKHPENCGIGICIIGGV